MTIRTRKTRWTLEVRENGRWREVYAGSRFMVTWRIWFLDFEGQARMVRDGRPLRIHTTDDQLDLFQEEES